MTVYLDTPSRPSWHTIRHLMRIAGLIVKNPVNMVDMYWCMGRHKTVGAPHSPAPVRGNTRLCGFRETLSV